MVNRTPLLALAALAGLPLVAVFGCISGDNNNVTVPIDPNPQLLPPEGANGLDGGPDTAGPITAEGAKLVLDTAPLDFGYVNCGASATKKTYKIKNGGAKALPYSVTVEGSAFSLEGPKSGTIAPDKEVELTVGASIPATATARAQLDGALVIASEAAEPKSVRIPLKVVPEGAMLEFSSTVAGFGQVKVGALAPPVNISVQNTGFVPVKVGFALPPGTDLGLSWTNVPDPIDLAPTVSQSVKATFAPSAAGMVSFNSTITVEGPVCGTVPTALELSGEGTYGSVLVGPSPIDFGTNNCGSAGALHPVTVQNQNVFPIHYTAVFTKGASSPFTISSASGTINGNTTATLNVTPKTLTPPRVLTANAYGDTLTITTDAPTDAAHVVDLRQTAKGAIFAVSVAPNAAFGPQTVNLPISRTVTATNSGNVQASLTMSTSAPFSVSPAAPSGISVAPGQSGTGSLTYTPASNVASSVNVTFGVTGPNCGAVPATIQATGTGTYPIYSLGSAIAAYSVTCGVAPTSQPLVIQNGAGAQGKLLITNIAVTGPFTVSPATLAPINPGGNATLTVNSKAPVIGTDKGGQTDSGTLTFKTNEAGNPTKTIALRRSVHGANIVYECGTCASGGIPIGNLDFIGCPNTTPVTAPFIVANRGDVDVAQVDSKTYTNYSFPDIQGAQSFPLPANTTHTMQGTYSGPIGATLPAVTQAAVSIPTTVGICIPPPAIPMQYVFVPQGTAPCN